MWQPATCVSGTSSGHCSWPSLSPVWLGECSPFQLTEDEGAQPGSGFFAPPPHSSTLLFVWTAPFHSCNNSSISLACSKRSCPVLRSLLGLGLGMALFPSPVPISRLCCSLSPLPYQEQVWSIAALRLNVAIFSTAIAERVVFPFS